MADDPSIKKENPAGADHDPATVATLNPATMEVLSLFRGDTIIVRGKKRKDTVLIVLSSDEVDEGKIQINKVTCCNSWFANLYLPAPFFYPIILKVARNNLRVKLGDVCNVHPCHDIKYGRRIHVLPFDDSIDGLTGNIFEVFLKPYFLEGLPAFLLTISLCL
ncbi:hypothetical protein PPACK8108_LOCUS16499 [Phakopsora pachyrhizi]|uniref:CDC48 N-terminal subdomain domain-containing protein n=1 Tax=Phakopsora pachyrhizi TaxID=170000 RepID=A0AAV0B878_PHAPC|nr:hypothetical protein PPACK8108_LOCUS16499 [Phakopsora pachyrhizi]